jgi:diguanylate cyclase (GGDEF)-like protein/PAS domain S-box-containing protein
VKINEQNDELLQDIKDAVVRSSRFQDWTFEAIFIFDESLICIDANKAASKLFQYEHKELIGMKLSGLTHREGLPSLRTKAKTKSAVPYEARMIRRDGSSFIGVIDGENAVMEGMPIHIITVRDISHIIKIERDLALKKNELATIFSNQLIGIIIQNQDSTIAQANDVAARILGYENAAELIGIFPLDHYVLLDDYFMKKNGYMQTVLNGEIVKDNLELKRKDGSTVWVTISGGPISTAVPPDLSDGILWLLDDITNIKQAEAEKVKAYRELEVIFNNALVGIVVTDKKRKIQKANQAAADIIGCATVADLAGKSFKDFHLNDESFEAFGEKHYPQLIVNEVQDVDCRVKRVDGREIWLAISGRAIDTQRPPDLDKGVVWVFRDISERKIDEEKILQLTREDSLTGASNRRHFVEQANREIELMRRYGKPLSLIMLDIDHFKKVNDNYGHAIGDKALVFVARMCREATRQGDIIGRLGGEEFSILLLEAELDRAKEVGIRIISDLKTQTGGLSNIPLMTASIGAIQIDKHENLEKALKRADDLLYKAKNLGRDRLES